MTRIEILQKLAAGELTVDEATRLLQEAVESGSTTEPQEEKAKRDEAAQQAEAGPEKRKNGEGARAARRLRIRVGRVGSERDHVRVNIPIGLVEAGLRLGLHFGDHKWSRALSEVMDSIHRGDLDTLFEVEDDHSGERVRIYMD